MPSSDKEGFPDGCYLCEGRAGTLHHISYVPEKVILVCSHCHGRVHGTGYDGELSFPDLHPKMNRGEWKETRWEGEWIPRPRANQIEWDENGVGEVKR